MYKSEIHFCPEIKVLNNSNNNANTSSIKRDSDKSQFKEETRVNKIHVLFF